MYKKIIKEYEKLNIIKKVCIDKNNNKQEYLYNNNGNIILKKNNNIIDRIEYIKNKCTLNDSFDEKHIITEFDTTRQYTKYIRHNQYGNSIIVNNELYDNKIISVYYDTDLNKLISKTIINNDKVLFDAQYEYNSPNFKLKKKNIKVPNDECYEYIYDSKGNLINIIGNNIPILNDGNYKSFKELAINTYGNKILDIISKVTNYNLDKFNIVQKRPHSKIIVGESNHYQLTINKLYCGAISIVELLDGINENEILYYNGELIYLNNIDNKEYLETINGIQYKVKEYIDKSYDNNSDNIELIIKPKYKFKNYYLNDELIKKELEYLL